MILGLVRTVSRLPRGVLYALTDALAFLAFRVLRVRRRLVVEQIAEAFPGKSRAEVVRIAARSYHLLGDLVAEVVKSATIDEEELRRRVELDRVDVIERYTREGRSVLLVSAHHSNWELAFLGVCVQLGVPFHSIYKPLHDAWAEVLMKKIRTRFGGEMIPAKEIVPDLVRRKSLVRCVGMVADQAPVSSRTRIWLDFLGRETAFYPGPDEIARAFRMPVVFMAVERRRRGFYEVSFRYVADAREPMEPHEITRRYAREVERQIREAPAEWFWMHRRWKVARGLYE